MLSKTDFIHFLDSPMHLWAYKHDQLDAGEESPFVQHLFKEGYKAEKLAKKYLQSFVLPTFTKAKLAWQHDYTDEDFYAKSDAVIFDEDSNAYHIFEIKSGTKVKPENLYDATFQTLVCEAYVPIGSVSILHLNKDYLRDGELNLNDLFAVEDVTEKVMNMREEVLNLRKAALQVIEAETPQKLASCYQPQSCPCLTLCHPGLPEYSIYELMQIRQSQKEKLLADGLVEIAAIPDDYPLKDFQLRQVQAVKHNQPVIKHEAIKQELDKLTYPLWFLDYETYLSALPLWDRCKPQQQNVFQYSLHKLDHPDSKLEHFEYLCMDSDEPAKRVLKYLRQHLGETGSVIVWNKTFEMGRNKEMAVMYPKYADFLHRINSRVWDLMEIFKQGLYIHPEFHGSWSIKNVLPVLVPELTYKGMSIAKGDEAMLAWWDLVHQRHSELDSESIKHKDSIKQALLEYCQLDTLAMVEIWKKLSRLENRFW